MRRENIREERRMMMMEMFLRRKKIHRSGRQTDAAAWILWNELRSSFFSFPHSFLRFAIFLLFLRHCTHKWSFHFQPPLAWNEISLGSFFRCFYRRLFSSSLQSNFLSRLEFGSNVFSFLLMQVFYVFLSVHWDGKLRKRRGGSVLENSSSCLHFPNVDLRRRTTTCRET